ncbi:hypothetical protein D5R93_06265 [Actinomyces lilanjuaniae]|uniref:Uncharacterized protein n=1 Tax=Actinomyces lilanjuaniae TaxID=2321394 RepID=A0ABN5PRP7_9ACTO|nr:hypothetical protein [Actinomyces lilanjuaniae]AYD89747.1 hypothetical protein D5R93_06265 [Actinomyces lilanjuaniae]
MAQDRREAPTGTDLARTTRLREASFPHPPTTVRTPPAQAQPQAGPTTDRPPRPLTREEVLARITAAAQQPTQPPPHARPPPETADATEA